MVLFYIFIIDLVVIYASDCRIGYAGPTCETKCTDTCYNKTCILTLKGDIECTYGCEAGYFGEPCSMICDEKCKRCNRLERHTCTECYGDYYGPNCDETSTDSDSTPTTIIVVVVLVVVFCITCVIVITFLVYRNYKKKTQEETVSPARMRNNKKKKERALPPIPQNRDTSLGYCEITDEIGKRKETSWIQTDTSSQGVPSVLSANRVSFSDDFPSRMTEIGLVESDV